MADEKCPKCGAAETRRLRQSAHYECGSWFSGGKWGHTQTCRIRELEQQRDRAYLALHHALAELAFVNLDGEIEAIEAMAFSDPADRAEFDAVVGQRSENDGR